MLAPASPTANESLRDAYGIAASLSQLFYASPRRGATTGELLAMPTAFLTPHS